MSQVKHFDCARGTCLEKVLSGKSDQTIATTWIIRAPTLETGILGLIFPKGTVELGPFPCEQQCLSAAK